MSQKRIVVVGGICFDFVSYVERFPRQNETVFSNKFLMANGGKGASAAVMASLIGADVKLIGQTGDDIFADSCLKMLSKVGINTQHIVRNRNATTAIAIIQVDSKGENCLVTHLGANMEFMPDQIKQFETQIASANILLCQNEIPHESNLTAFRLARKHNVTTFLNAAPYRDGITLEDELFKLTNILCTNETETEALIGRQLQCIEDFEKAARDLLKVGPKYVIVTLGENGCLVAEQLEDGSVKVNKFDAIKVEVVDTTGAGDCFCGAFAYFYVSGLGVNDCAKKAAQVASLSTTRPGNQSSYPTKEELKNLCLLMAAPITRRKHLNGQGNAVNFFFYHYLKCANQRGAIRSACFLKLLLVSQKFCQEYSKSGSCFLSMFTNILAFNVKYKEFTVEIFKGNLLDFPANFICGFGVSSLHIYAVSQEPERQMFKHYARFCKKIKDANTVKKISLYIDTITSIENRTLMDLLPDAITELSGSPQGAQLMWKRQTVLETIEIKVEDTYDSINDVFVSVYYKPMLECRARHIKLKNDPYASSYVYGLDGMHDLYPMKKNPHLETLQVFARMISTIYEVREANEDYDNMKEDKVWLNGRLEKYKRAFKALNSLNPSLMLRVKDDQSYLLNLLTIGKVGEKLELFIENTAAFCQAAVDAQVNLKDVKVRIHMCLPTQGYLTEKWRGICLAQIEKRGFKDKDTSHNNYVAMDGKLILHNIPVNVRLFVMKGNLNEGAQDPFNGEWSSKEFQHSRSGTTGDFY